METILCNGKIPENFQQHKIDYDVFSDFMIPQLPLQYAIMQSFGQLLFYEMKIGKYVIQYSLFNILNNMEISIFGTYECPNLFINIWNSLRYNINDIPTQKLGPYQFCLENRNKFKWSAHLQKGKQYSFINFLFTTDYLQPVLDRYGNVNPLGNYKQNNMFAFPDVVMASSSTMIQDIYKILSCSYTFGLKQVYLEQIVKAILLEAIDKTLQNHQKDILFAQKLS